MLKNVEIAFPTYPAEDGMHHARRSMDVKTLFYQPVDDRLDLGLRRALLHNH